MPRHTRFPDTVPVQPPAMTPDEAHAFKAGRQYQERISFLEGARLARVSWFCLGLILGVALRGCQAAGVGA